MLLVEARVPPWALPGGCSVLPSVQALTHARPTGYDPDGRCVPMRVAKRKTDDPNAAPTPAPAPTPAEAAEDPAGEPEALRM